MNISEWLILAGILFIFLGSFGMILESTFSEKNSVSKSNSEKKSNVKFAVVGFLGPIPLGFSNDKSFLKFTIIISIIALIVFVLIWLRMYQ